MHSIDGQATETEGDDARRRVLWLAVCVILQLHR